jgi:hypothetical protein
VGSERSPAQLRPLKNEVLKENVPKTKKKMAA